MEKTITTNQLSLILIIFTVALKLSVLPAITCDFAGNNAYVVSFVSLAIDFLLTFVIVIIMQKIPQKNFFDLLKETLSKPVAIFLYLILFFYFFLKLLIALLELQEYYIVALFEQLNPFFFIIALMLLLLFLFNKSFRTIGRLIEVCFWPLALGILFTLLYPIKNIDLVNLLPLFEDGLYPAYNGFARTSFAYGDYMVLLILMGKVNFSKKSTKKIMLYFASILYFIFSFYVIFVGAFGSTSVNKSLAIGELPLHNPNPSTIGRLEWLTIIMWTAILIIQTVIIGKCCCECFKQIFKLSDNKIPSIVLVVALTVLYVPLYLKLESIIKIATSNVFAIITCVLHLLFFILLVISYFIYMRKQNKTKYAKQKGGGTDGEYNKKIIAQ